MPNVTINRDSGYADSIRRYKVFLNGTLVGKIASGQSQTFDIAPGDHTLQVKIDWSSTPKMSFRVADEPIAFECFSKLRGPRLFLALFAIFNPRGWIGIRRLEDAKGMGLGEPNGPANGSQPIRSDTNSTSPAAGSRR